MNMGSSSREGYNNNNQAKQEKNDATIDLDKFSKAATSSTSTFSTSRSQWSAFRNPRIVRVSRSFGGKDRHSKVCTVRGLRDRRIRLSIPTAIQLYDLQHKLGLNQPSKVIDWLLDATKVDIEKLPPLHFPPGLFSPQFQFHQTLFPFHHGQSTAVSPFFDSNNNLLMGMSSRTRSNNVWDLDHFTARLKGKWIGSNDEEENNDNDNNNNNDNEDGGGRGRGSSYDENNNNNHEFVSTTQRLFPSSSILPNSNNNNATSASYNYQFGSLGLFPNSSNNNNSHHQVVSNSNGVNSSQQFPLNSSLLPLLASSSSCSSGNSQLYQTPAPSVFTAFPPPPFAENNDPRAQFNNIHHQFPMVHSFNSKLLDSENNNRGQQERLVIHEEQEQEQEQGE